MAITGLPEITARQILTKSDLDAIINSLTAKMAGAIGSADIAWPLTAGGNIDFDGSSYTITNLRSFWNIFNAKEYGLQAAIDAAETAGGGCVIIEPDHEESVSGITIQGNYITIMGYGESSVIKASGAAALFTIGTSRYKGVQFINLTLDGNSTGTIGIQGKYTDKLLVQNVWIKDFTTAGIDLTNSGTDGQGCRDTRLIDVKMDSNTAEDITGDDIYGLTIIGLTSRGCGDNCIELAAAGTASYMRNIHISDSFIEAPGGRGVSILGFDGDDRTIQSQITLHNVKVYDSTDHSFYISEPAALLKYVELDGCISWESDVDAFVVGASNLSIQNCKAYNPGGDCLDLANSQQGTISNNAFIDAGAYAIDASTTINCRIRNNDLTGFATGAIKKTGTTSLIAGDNLGDFGPSFGGSFSTYVGVVYSDTKSASTLYTYTIPANTLDEKMGVKVTAIGKHTGGGGGTATFTLGVDGNPAMSLPGIGSANAVQVVAYAVIDSTNTDMWGYGVADVQGANILSEAVITWTDAIDITVEVQSTTTADTDMTLDRVLIEYIGGNQV